MSQVGQAVSCSLKEALTLLFARPHSSATLASEAKGWPAFVENGWGHVRVRSSSPAFFEPFRRNSTGADVRTTIGAGAAPRRFVHVKAEADPPYRLINCKVCKRSLAPTDREYILKYFLISRKQAAKHWV